MTNAAIKNQTEVNGARTAHIRDGAAVTEFLAWLHREVPKGNVTELSAVDQQEQPRLADDRQDRLSCRG